MQKKYEIIKGEFRPKIDWIDGADGIVYRIVALRDIPSHNVRKGDKGGFVESEDNLDHAGDCWIADDACACGGAYVGMNAALTHTAVAYGDAIISRNAKICDTAEVSGNAYVSGIAKVDWCAKVSGSAWIIENAYVSGAARVTGDAVVSGDAIVCDNAVVDGSAVVCDSAIVDGDARVTGDTLVSGRAKLHGGRVGFLDRIRLVLAGLKKKFLSWL